MSKGTKVIEVTGPCCPFADDMGRCAFGLSRGCVLDTLDVPGDGCPLQEYDQIIVKLKK